MLRQRVITGVILAAALLAALFLLETDHFAWVFAGLVMLAANEWAPLAGIGALWQRLLFCLALAGALLLLAFNWHWLSALLILTLAVWLIACVRVFRFNATPPTVASSVLDVLMGLVILTAAWGALVYLHGRPAGPVLILLAFGLVWCADIGAYFAGRRFGQRRLAPNVSPGKTWEGAWGGLLLALVVLGAVLFVSGVPQWLLLTSIAVPVLVALSVFGDLFESVLKRQSGRKDSGTLLPGHGGLLDRIDSLLAVLPAYTLLVLQGPLNQ